jgi:hypothetical protein
MDTIGLLAAWVGVVSCLFAIVVAVSVHVATPRFQRWWARTSRARVEKRIETLLAGLAMNGNPDNAYIADLISLYGSMIVNLIAGAALVIVSIEILDLGPALLASMLPFNIDAKMLTEAAGLLTLVSSYFLIFRLSYLALKIRLRTLPRKRGYAEEASREIAQLRAAQGLPAEHIVR